METKSILLVGDSRQDEMLILRSLRNRSYENGANRFVRKPLDFSAFAETVARLGVYWLATNAPPRGRIA